MQTYVHARIPCTDMHATYMHTHISAYAYFDVPDGAYVWKKFWSMVDKEDAAKEEETKKERKKRRKGGAWRIMKQ